MVAARRGGVPPGEVAGDCSRAESRDGGEDVMLGQN